MGHPDIKGMQELHLGEFQSVSVEEYINVSLG